MEKDQDKRPGKCESCGLAMPDKEGRGAWKFFCIKNGKGKRGGDSCGGYWEDGEMKRTIDTIMQLVKSL